MGSRRRLLYSLSDLSISIIIVYALYYIVYGLAKIPVHYDRITLSIVNETPLLGLYEIDLFITFILTGFIHGVMGFDYRKYIVSITLMIIGYMLLVVGLIGGNLVFTTGLVVTIYCYYRYKRTLEYIVLYTLALLLIIDVIVVSIVFTKPLCGQNLVYSVLYRERSIWVFIEYLSIILFIITMWIHLIRFIPLRKLKTLANKIYLNINMHFTKRAIEYKSLFSGVRGLIIGLVITLAIVIIPHLPVYNPEYKPISVDTIFYWKIFIEASEKGLWNTLYHSGLGRPLYISFLFIIWKTFFSNNTVLFLDILHPLFSLMLLVYVSYLLSLKYFGEEVAGYTAILTASGHSVVTFIAGGYQANAISLAIALLCFYFYPERPLHTILLFALVILIHPWTFLMYVIVFLVYYLFVYRVQVRRVFKHLILLMFIALLTELILRSMTSCGLVSLYEKPLTLGVKLHTPVSWINTFEQWTWGSMSNAIVLLGSTLYVGYNFITTALAVTAPATIMSNEVILHRIILNIPIEILVARVLTSMDRRTSYLLVCLAVTKTFITLSTLTPLSKEPWTSIIPSV